jgi:multiple sugar transport system substrate-binding protein
VHTALTRRTAALFLAAASALSVTSACGSSSSGSSGSSANGGSGGKVTLTFVNWDGGMQAVVDRWNKENPDIQVQLSKPSGTGYTLYNKLITNNAAGTNPDVTEVEYQALPALIANKVVVPIDKYVGDISAGYDKSSLAQVQFEGKTYGLPQNTCPMAFFYRKDIFDQLGLKPPTTWDEYAADAATVHSRNPKQYIGNFSAVDSGWFAGLAQQAGADWWTTSGTTWKVAIDDAPTKKVADYWSDLVQKGLIDPEPNWSPQWSTEMNDGTIIGWVSAQWAPNQLPSIAKDTAGKWVAAPLPAWTAGDPTVGIWGGETEAVTASSKHPAEAAKFVKWLNSSPEASGLLIQQVDVFPASIPNQSQDALKTPPPFMSDQPDYNTLMAQLAKNVRTFQVWGPNANVTFDTYSNAFAAALQNKTPLSEALEQMQKATVDDMKQRGFSVAN